MCDAKITRQHPGKNSIIGALKTRLQETPEVTSRLSDRAVQRSNSRPGPVIAYWESGSLPGFISSAAGAVQSH